VGGLGDGALDPGADAVTGVYQRSWTVTLC
jgi:hypothetical protein